MARMAPPLRLGVIANNLVSTARFLERAAECTEPHKKSEPILDYLGWTPEQILRGPFFTRNCKLSRLSLGHFLGHSTPSLCYRAHTLVIKRPTRAPV